MISWSARLALATFTWNAFKGQARPAIYMETYFSISFASNVLEIRKSNLQGLGCHRPRDLQFVHSFEGPGPAWILPLVHTYCILYRKELGFPFPSWNETEEEMDRNRIGNFVPQQSGLFHIWARNFPWCWLVEVDIQSNTKVLLQTIWTTFTQTTATKKRQETTGRIMLFEWYIQRNILRIQNLGR